MTIGQKLAEKRKKYGMTQDEVAERLGVTPQAVSKWETGASCPDITLLPKLAKLYGTTTDELLSEESTPEVVVVPEEKRKSIDEMILRIRVHDDGDKVNVNIPISIVKAAISTGLSANMSFGKRDFSKIDFSALIEMVEQGALGKLMDIEESDGSTIVIEVV